MKFIKMIYYGAAKIKSAIREFFWLFLIFIGFPLTTIASFMSGIDYMKDGERTLGIFLFVFGIVIALLTIGFIYGTIFEWKEKITKKKSDSSV
ncbi:hypothetical protein M3181_03095 [Mesobacillus maritimus]|uniref:hypothetical protein n=1 Tax=Mesobacillus maritimus TaxID=1643336 RepID=UPI00203EEA9D|nr:hypothetical protein [Mesobacillus maritimus]MCM3667989.1 hypothetical protein [Mesobacillus maritimus]